MDQWRFYMKTEESTWSKGKGLIAEHILPEIGCEAKKPRRTFVTKNESGGKHVLS